MRKLNQQQHLIFCSFHKIDQFNNYELSIHSTVLPFAIDMLLSFSGHFMCKSIPKTPLRYFEPSDNKSLDVYSWSMMLPLDTMALDLSKPPGTNSKQGPNSHRNPDLGLGLGLRWLDMSPVFWRSDAHPAANDCLHFMLPGPMNLFSILVLQMLYNNEI